MNDRIIHKRSNSPNMKPIIEIKNLAAGYDGRTVLHDVNLNVYERDFLGIIGPNGGGKTTLIKCILGLLKPTAGEIIFHTPTEPSGTPQTVTSGAQTSLGYLPQYSTIDRKFPISVEEVILSGLSIQKSLTSRFTPEQKEKGKQIIVRISHDIGTVLQQVKSIACVNETLDYHPDTGVSTEWLEKNFNCPIELLGHGTLPHRVLGEHHHHH